MKYSQFVFHCSMLPLLMRNGKGGELSETTKTELEKLWIEKEYGRTKDITTKYTEKGIICESESIKLLNKKLESDYKKNGTVYSSDFIMGTPDIVGECVIDIKTSWDLWTFIKADYEKAKKDYYYQLLGYMILTGCKKGKIAYCLTNTPKSFIDDELYKLTFQFQENEEKYKVQARQIEKNMTFDDIPEDKRVKIFEFELNLEDVNEIRERIIKWREYLEKLEL